MGARGRHARGERAPAGEAHENRFYTLSESAENYFWLSVRVRRETCQSQKTRNPLKTFSTIKGLITPLNGIIEDQILEVTKSVGLGGWGPVA